MASSGVFPVLSPMPSIEQLTAEAPYSHAVEALAKARVAVFGIGGVGSYTAEALARAGVGAITLVDNDTVGVSNLNRQLCALHSTLGKFKAEAMAERIRDINPSRTLWQRLFGVGTVTVVSSDKTMPNLGLKNVKDPVFVKELIHKQVEEMKIRRRVRVGEIMGNEIDESWKDSIDEDIRIRGRNW